MSKDAGELAPPVGAFSQTVAREMVHRWALSEVFITGFNAAGGREFLVDAQLPLYHAYYTDHAARPELFDPLLLLECCRQGGTYGTHELLGLPMNSTMLVKTASIRITDLDGLVIGTRPGELRMSGVFTDVEMRAGIPRNMGMDAELTLSGRSIGTARIEATAVAKTTFRTLRTRQRTGEPPTSSELPATPAGVPLSPHLFGRKLPENVVLTNARRDHHSTSAQLGVNPRNRSLFDHEYDHYPAMSLFEAARQLSLLALDDGTGAAATRVRCTSLRAEFIRFAELDSPVDLRIVGEHSNELDVHFVQDGTVIATTTVGFHQAGTSSEVAA
ncbi:ScbA/BarX family gamma-butyrolactone biosynthesis protein [Saccharopolyspora hattusasensis]|uniref:ScbA/BarX family gamma-butyrolactone biosynthesis protein n=1 Tax=Saccharopolyspora hattusasensis TaxID=1128679 RepID=UPI003D98945E